MTNYLTSSSLIFCLNILDLCGTEHMECKIYHPKIKESKYSTSKINLRVENYPNYYKNYFSHITNQF